MSALQFSPSPSQASIHQCRQLKNLNNKIRGKLLSIAKNQNQCTTFSPKWQRSLTWHVNCIERLIQLRLTQSPRRVSREKWLEKPGLTRAFILSNRPPGGSETLFVYEILLSYQTNFVAHISLSTDIMVFLININLLPISYGTTTIWYTLQKSLIWKFSWEIYIPVIFLTSLELQREWIWRKLS